MNSFRTKLMRKALFSSPSSATSKAASSSTFTPPVVKGRGVAKLIGGVFWFYIGYRAYHDGGHHFFHEHAWSSPKVIKYLDEVDEKYPGSKLGKDNMH